MALYQEYSQTEKLQEKAGRMYRELYAAMVESDRKRCKRAQRIGIERSRRRGNPKPAGAPRKVPEEGAQKMDFRIFCICPELMEAVEQRLPAREWENFKVWDRRRVSYDIEI